MSVRRKGSTNWSWYLEDERQEQRQLADAQTVVEDAQQNVLRWLLENPSAGKAVQVHVLALQERLAELGELIARRTKRIFSSKDDVQWAATVGEVYSLQKNAGEVFSLLTKNEKGTVSHRLPRQLPGVGAEARSANREQGLELPTLREFREMEVLTQVKAAHYLNCSTRTIRSYIQKGELSKNSSRRIVCSDDKWARKIRSIHPTIRTM